MGLPPMVAYNEILYYSGTQFDEEVCEAFKRVFEKSNMFKEEEIDHERLKSKAKKQKKDKKKKAS